MIVLDADVVIGWLDASDAHHRVSSARLSSWVGEASTLLLTLPTLAEVLVAPARDGRLELARAALRGLGVRLEPPTEPLAIDAAEIRAAHPISVPDAFCLATARARGAAVASFDDRLLRAARAEGLAVA